MRLSVWVTVLACALAPAACGPGQVDFFQPLAPDPAFPGTPGDSTSYDYLLAYTPDPSCTPMVPLVLDTRTEVRIFRGNGITMDDVARFVGGLKRYYDHYGVIMFTRHDVIQVPLDHAIVLNDKVISDWMSENTDVTPSAVPASGTPAYTQYVQAMGGAMYFNVKQFLHAYSEPQQNLINVVLLKRIASLDPSPDYTALNWGVAGLGISDALLNSIGGSDVGGSFADQLNESNFTPTVFVGVDLTDFVLTEPDIVIAHEVGHAFGLEHTQSDTNLMTQGLTNCSASLDSSQLQTIETATASTGNVLDANQWSALNFLSYVHREPEIAGILLARLAARATSGSGTP